MTNLTKNIQHHPLKSTQDLSKITQTVLEIAHRKGATDCAVSINHDKGFSVDVRMGQVETVTFNEDKGVGVTVYLGKKKGSASSSDLSLSALEVMVQAALDIAEVSAPDPCFGLPEQSLYTPLTLDLDLYHPWDVSPEAAIDLAKSCEAHALSRDKKIINSDGVNVSTYESFYYFANTHGGTGASKSTRHSLSCSLVGGTKDSMQRDYEYTQARHASDLLDYKQLAERAVLNTTQRLNPKSVKTGSMPVIFSNRVSSGLFSSLISAISGTNLYKKNSFLYDKLGETIFSPWINIYENPHLPRGLGSTLFDAEGVPTRPNVIVKDGALKQYVLSCYSARKLGLATTANSGGVHNLTIEPNHAGLSDIVKQIQNGIYVTELMGQGVNILTGDYSRGASGFYIENGEILYPVEGITIASNLNSIFKNIAAIGADINPNLSTRCGSVLVEEMMVAGG